MVAMFGWIMPAPLLMPVSVTVWPPIVTWRDAAFGSVSVVMMASAASNQLCGLQVRRARPAGPASMRSTGSGSRITPVENGSTCCGVDAQQARQRGAGRARARQARLAGAGVRVAGVDHQRADRLAAGAHGARCSRQTCTGAAQKRFCVNTPPTVRAFVERNDEHVLAVRLADVRLGPAERDAGDGMQLSGIDRGEIDGHGRDSSEVARCRQSAGTGRKRN